MHKRVHEVRDPIHTFIRLDSDERAVLDSPPLQRLRHIQQLAMASLVYPGATHKRFEHSLGVMELAGRVFDVITAPDNIQHPSVRAIVPGPSDSRKLEYWRLVLRIAALCHDAGHLPFSHAAEEALLPEGWNHERLTAEIIRHADMIQIGYNNLTPSPKGLDIVKLAVGPKKCAGLVKAGVLPLDAASFDDWESILSEVIVGDAFGVDRIDYLLRDSYHAGVAYGRFDHYRLIDTMRILPRENEEKSQEPALGVEKGGLHSAEALLLARYFMYSQVYFHPVARVYEVHLTDFLAEWLKTRFDDGKFPTEVAQHVLLSDDDIMVALATAARDEGRPGHESARRIVERDHFRLLYEQTGVDSAENPKAAEQIFDAAREKFGCECVRRDAVAPESPGHDFPVLTRDGRIESSLVLSETLRRIPTAEFDCVFIDRAKKEEAMAWLDQNREDLIQPTDKETADGTAEA